GHLDHAFGALDFTAAAEAIRAVVTRANRYVDETAPWKLATADPVRLNTVLYTLTEAERLIAIGLSAFLPTTAERMLTQLGTTAALSTSRFSTSYEPWQATGRSSLSARLDWIITGKTRRATAKCWRSGASSNWPPS